MLQEWPPFAAVGSGTVLRQSPAKRARICSNNAAHAVPNALAKDKQQRPLALSTTEAVNKRRRVMRAAEYGQAVTERT